MWPTEVMFGDIPDDVLSPVVDEMLSSNVSFTNGDITDTFLTNDPRVPVLANFINTFVLDAFKQYSSSVFDYQIKDDNYKLNAWANNGSGMYSLGFHNHAGAQLSAIFYLLIDENDGVGGKLSLHDPRFNANRGLISPFKFKHADHVIAPKSGQFIIFPSYLYHSISTFHGHTRLILPVDLFIKD